MIATAQTVREAPRRQPVRARGTTADQAHAMLARHPHFRGRSDCVRLSGVDGDLTVDGVLPSFYLKQLVQRVLRDVPGVVRINNRVIVANAQGLSSEPR